MPTTLGRWISYTVSKFPRNSVRNVQTTHFARKVLGCTTLGVAFANCEKIAADAERLKTETLTREQCIKQACLLSVNSASTLLTTTSSAVLDICKEYKDSLNAILYLLEELQNIGGESPQLWDAIIEARAHVNRAKAALTELNSYMESVEKVVTSTTEAAFLAGAEYICTALCERLHSAQKEINNQILELKKLEEEYIKVQKDIASSKDTQKKTKTSNAVEVGSNIKNNNKINNNNNNKNNKDNNGGGGDSFLSH